MKITISIFIAFVMMGINSVMAEKPKGEFFLAAPPKGWTLVDNETQLHIANFRFVPAGESAKKWSQMVTITKMTGESMLPDKFLIQTAEINAQNCDGYEIQRLAFKSTNGYPTHGMIENCSKNKKSNKGELAIIRAIKGNDHLFVIQRTWRLKPYDLAKGFPIPKEKIDETIIKFSSAKVCDTRKGTCPENMGK